MQFRYDSKEHKYLQRLLKINPKLTVGEAIRKLENFKTMAGSLRPHAIAS